MVCMFTWIQNTWGTNRPTWVYSSAKQVNFAGNLILQILHEAQIQEIKLPQNCKVYIGSKGKVSIFMKLSARKNCNHFQIVK